MHWSSRLAILYSGLCLAAIGWAPLRSGGAGLRWQTVQGLTLPWSLLAGSGATLSQWSDTVLALGFAVAAGLNALLLVLGLRGLTAFISRLERLDEADSREIDRHESSSDTATRHQDQH